MATQVLSVEAVLEWVKFQASADDVSALYVALRARELKLRGEQVYQAKVGDVVLLNGLRSKCLNGHRAGSAGRRHSTKSLARASPSSSGDVPKGG